MKKIFRKILFIFILFFALLLSRKIISLHKLNKNYLINYLKKIRFLFTLRFLSPLLVYNSCKFVINKFYNENNCLLINSLAFVILKNFYSDKVNLVIGINKEDEKIDGHCWIEIFNYKITNENNTKYEIITKI